MKVKELIALLQELPPEIEVIIPLEDARSRTPRPAYGEAFDGGWGFTLGERYAGFREAQRQLNTFPVVWL